MRNVTIHPGFNPARGQRRTGPWPASRPKMGVLTWPMPMRRAQHVVTAAWRDQSAGRGSLGVGSPEDEGPWVGR
jgi:hypothetical protein